MLELLEVSTLAGRLVFRVAVSTFGGCCCILLPASALNREELMPSCLGPPIGKPYGDKLVHHVYMSAFAAASVRLSVYSYERYSATTLS